jgi:hypothetical protein
MSSDSRNPQTEEVHGDKSLYKNWPLMSSIIAYCVFTLHDTAYSEVIFKYGTFLLKPIDEST